MAFLADCVVNMERLDEYVNSFLTQRLNSEKTQKMEVK
jgi:hypothetical protein